MHIPRPSFRAFLAPLAPFFLTAILASATEGSGDVAPQPQPAHRKAAVAGKSRPTERGGVPQLHLSLKKAIQLAMEKNLAIKVEAFSPKIASANVTIANGAFDPNFTGEISHSTTDFGPYEANSSSASLGISGFTPLGTQYSAGVAASTSRSRLYKAGPSLGLTQPLLRGFGTDVNLAPLHIARNNRGISEWVFKQQVIDVITETVYAYDALFSSMREYEAAVRSEEAALQLQHDEESEVRIGTKTPLDVTTAAADAAQRVEAVILAQSSIAENQRILKQLVTNDTKTLLETELSIEPPALPASSPVDVEDGVRDALLKRPDYQEALLELRNRHIQIVVSKNSTLPRIDLTGSLNFLGLTDSDVFSSLGSINNGTRTWGAGIGFSIPIPNRTARGTLQRDELGKAQALVGLQRMEQAIIVDVANAAGDINTARQRIDSTKEALRLAKESLEGGEQRLKAGSATTFEVLQLQEKLKKAEAAQIKAEGDYRNALAEYDRKTGTALERNGIVIAP